MKQQRRVKTRYAYHDSLIKAAEWTKLDELRLTIALDGHWNNQRIDSVAVFFCSVRNRAEIERWIDARPAELLHLGDIAAIVREPGGAYVIDATPGSPLRVECGSMIEA